MKTFEGLSKRNFIFMMNDRSFESNWSIYGFVYNHRLCIIGGNIGLEVVNSKKTISPPNSRNNAYYKVVDIPNYNELIPIFNSLKVLKKIGEEFYIVKDNFNVYKKNIGHKPFSEYYFKKLSELSGYKLIKKIK